MRIHSDRNASMRRRVCLEAMIRTETTESEPVSTYGAVLVLDGHEEWRSEWVWQYGHWVRLAPAPDSTTEQNDG